MLEIICLLLLATGLEDDWGKKIKNLEKIEKNYFQPIYEQHSVYEKRSSASSNPLQEASNSE